MNNYIINKNTDNNGYNEIHKSTCNYLPYSHNQHSLGFHFSDADALSYAKSIGYNKADGCKHCCPSINKG